MQTSKQFKQKVVEAILAYRDKFTGNEAQFAKKLGINKSVYSQLKKGKIDKVLSENKWVSLGREFNVTVKGSNWKSVRTEVYQNIEDLIRLSKETANSFIFVDETSIGKTFSAYDVSKRLQNVFYVDCSQCETKGEFIKSLAKEVGLDGNGKYKDIKADIKYTLGSVLENPVVVLDEAGDLNYAALLSIKEFWNATEGHTGWVMLGAEGLKDRVNRGLRSKKVGFAELFARFSSNFVNITPADKNERQEFQRHLLRQVAEANAKGGQNINQLVNNCLASGYKLRHLKTLIQMNE